MTTAAAGWTSTRPGRIAIVVITGAFIVLAAVDLANAWVVGRWHGAGVDYGIYMGAARRVLDGGSWYLARQLAGSYQIMDGDVLYPPTILVLLVPFTVLPAVLWWVVPLSIWVTVALQLRPARWTWPIIAACLWWPRTDSQVLFGNPVMWAAAAMWLGALRDWPSVLVFLKPTVAPFALFGIRSRSWWVALGCLAIVSAPFAWQYLQVLLDARSNSGWLYSLEEWPMLAIPIVAWLGSPRRAARGRVPMAQTIAAAIER